MLGKKKMTLKNPLAKIFLKIKYENTKEIGKVDGRVLKRNTRRVFPGMKFSSTGEARFKVEMAPGHGRFSFTGIKSLSVKAEKVKEE